jgi:hypothetical protein
VRFGNATHAPTIVTVDGAYTVGQIHFDHTNKYTLTGPGSLSLQTHGAAVGEGNAAIRVFSGSHAIAVPLTLIDSTDVDVATTSRLDLQSISISPGKSLTKLGGGLASIAGTGINGDSSTSVIAQAGSLEATSIHAGTLQIAAGANASVKLLGGASAPSSLSSISIPTLAGQYGGTLDVGSSALIIHSDDPAATLAQLTDMVRSARNQPVLWSGPGITSSAAASNPIKGLVAMRNQGEDGKPLLTTLGGESLDANCVLVMYTFNGDTDLDGRITFDDYYQTNRGFLSAGAKVGYRWGDFNYDGRVNFDDYYLMNQAFLGQNRATTALALPAVVPEPGVWVLASACLAALLAVRKRKLAVISCQSPARSSGN